MPGARYIAQVAFQGPSGIPRDQFENVWHFTSAAGLTGEDILSIAARLASFYCTIGAGGGFAIGSIMTPAIDRIASVKIYDEDEVRPPGTPRTLLTTNHFTLPDSVVTQGLPEQIALCLSYYSVSNVAGNRGRIYLGPWNVSALEEDVNPRPAANLLAVIRQQALTLSVPAAPTTAELAMVSNPSALTSSTVVDWAQRSGKGGAGGAHGVVLYRDVEAGWIDNEWDGQSRRRVAASARVVFS